MSTNSMARPVEPNKEDCCNSGCNPCIFEIYEKQLKIYGKSLDIGEYSQSRDNGILDIGYTKFIVVKNLVLCSNHNLIAFKRELPDLKKVWWKPGDHFLFKYISSAVTCTRAYTPIIIQNITKEKYDFAIIIKKYDNGVVSSHLYNLNEGSVTLWRGPYGHYKIRPNKFRRIIMIAQGTGIAPFIGIISSVLSNEDDMTKISLLYCCKSVNTILFRDELYTFKSYWNFIYEIHLKEPCCSADMKYQEPIKNCRLNRADLLNWKPFSINDQFLICGSQEFNKDYDLFLRHEFPFVENIVLF